jgi:hypothetical protein
LSKLNNQFFYTHLFDESDTKSDDDADLMVVVASMLHEENEAYMPQWRGSMPGRAANLDAIGRTATRSSTPTTFTRKWHCTETISGAIFGCQGSYLGELLKVFASTTHISDANRMPQVNLASLHIKKMLGFYTNACLWSGQRSC